MKQRTVLVTCVDKYMGRAIVDRLTELDFRVLTDTQALVEQSQCEELVRSVGEVDILIANLAEPPISIPVQALQSEDRTTLISTLAEQ